MSTHLIHLIDVATVKVDTLRSTLEVLAPKDGERLGVGFATVSPELDRVAASHRQHIEELATKHLTKPPAGYWIWCLADGNPVFELA